MEAINASANGQAARFTDRGRVRDATPAPRQAIVDLGPIEDLLRKVHESSKAVGQAPPCPPTWRGRVGRRLVLVVRRMLFWYTPQITAYQDAMSQLAREQLKALAAIAAHLSGEPPPGPRRRGAEGGPPESLGARLDKIEEALETQKRATESMIWEAQETLAAAHEKLREDLESALRDLKSLRTALESAGSAPRRPHP